MRARVPATPATKLAKVQRKVYQTVAGGGKLIGLNEQRDDLLECIKSCVGDERQNTSAMLLGFRGTGKTKLLKEVFETVEKDINEKITKIYLNGFIHTDDSYALQEIARQMKWAKFQLENDAGAEQESGQRRQAFEANLQLVVTMLKDSNNGSPVFFILDEFDLFAARTKQTLLYNLFDLLHTDNRFGIIGITTRKDVFELLEKRIRSRFSHKKIHFSGANTHQELLDILEQALLTGNLSRNWDKSVKALLSKAGKYTKLKKQIKHFWEMGVGTDRVLQAAVNAVAELPLGGPIEMDSETLCRHFDKLAADSRMELLRDLSHTEMQLVIAAMYLELKKAAKSYTILLLQKEINAAGRQWEMHQASQPCCKKSFERLLTLGLFLPVKATQKEKTQMEFLMVKCMLNPVKMRKFIRKNATALGLPMALETWAGSMHLS